MQQPDRDRRLRDHAAVAVRGKRAAGFRAFHALGPRDALAGLYGLPLSARVRALLEPHFSMNDRFGICPRTVQRMVKRVANRAALARPVTPHVLRHTLALTAVQKGISLPALQGLLGHEYLGTTQIYLTLSPEDVIGEFTCQPEVAQSLRR